MQRLRWRRMTQDGLAAAARRCDPSWPGRRARPPSLLLAVSLAALLISGCAPLRPAAPASAGLETRITAPLATLDAGIGKLLASIDAGRVRTDPQRRMIKALEFVREHQLDKASHELNAALHLDPTSSLAQMLNAFVYQLMARDGDSAKLVLAEQGYLLSAQFDKSNWVAHYMLGMLFFEQRDFKSAQRELADVLLFIGEDEEVLLRMVAASYYAGDPVTASACLQRLRALSPQDPEVLRLSALVSAAIGEQVRAEHWVEQYQRSGPAPQELQHLRSRVQQWNLAHRASAMNDTTVAKVPVQFGGAPAQGQIQGGSPFGAAPGAAPATNPWGGAPAANGAATPGGAAKVGGTRMVLVDVVIMLTADTLSTSKGVNLLNALSVQFSRQLSTNRTTSSTGDGGAAGEAVNTAVNMTRAINIPMLTYSLNIANANTDLNEVLARPTLAALDGVASQFFSGTNLSAAVVATGTQGGSSIQIEKKVGVKLTVLPTFLADNRLRLNIDAQRTFLKPPNSNVDFTYKLEVSEIAVNANVVMEFGETLILGGLSEKETTYTRDGVPVLQDIPGVQYLFASRHDSNFQRSVLMLITPRLPQYTYRNEDRPPPRAGAASAAGGAEVAGGAAAGSAAQAARAETSEEEPPSMKELRARYGDWFKPYPTLASVFNHLNRSSMYREFRTGDVALERWDQQSSLVQRLRQAFDFLFF